MMPINILRNVFFHSDVITCCAEFNDHVYYILKTKIRFRLRFLFPMVTCTIYVSDIQISSWNPAWFNCCRQKVMGTSYWYFLGFWGTAALQYLKHCSILVDWSSMHRWLTLNHMTRVALPDTLHCYTFCAHIEYKNRNIEMVVTWYLFTKRKRTINRPMSSRSLSVWI